MTTTRKQKPTVAELVASGLDLEAQDWQRSGEGPGSVEVAFAGEWIFLRKAEDPEGLVLVYDELEWDCFLDGVKKGEFDDIGTEPPPPD